MTSRLSALSRSQVQRLIRSGAVLVGGRPAKSSQSVEAGDLVEVELPQLEATDLEAEDLGLRVVYESRDVVVVDKPAGILVHPTSHDRQGTMVNGMLWLYPEMASVGPSGRQGVVHRLDKDTSGLVIFGRTVEGLRGMQEQFRAHEVWKTYTALVVGVVEPAAGVIDAPVGRHPHHRVRQAVIRRGGRPARTQYETVEALRGYSLLHAHPLTGRTHQIRVHFAALHHPVAGDPLYGRGARDLSLARQFLHAAALRFRDPGTGEWVELGSDLPSDLSQALDQLRRTTTTG